MELDNGSLLQVLDPAATGDVSVVLIDLPVAVLPRVTRARSQLYPGQQGLCWRLDAVGPVVDVV